MSDIRKAFVSRYTDTGVLLELDYSQLEIYVLAYLSGDKQLKEDLLSGKDLHNISATMLFGHAFTPAERKIAKQLSFQLQYGAGARSMAETNNIRLELAETFIRKYYERYTGVAAYQKAKIAEVDANRQSSLMRTKSGLPAGISKISSETGRIYTFVEMDSPDWMKKATGFSPTKVKNYFTQGFATGDIVPTVLGVLHRELKQWCKTRKYTKDVILVNTIHDSVMFDCESRSAAIEWATRAKEIMESAPDILKKVYNIDFDLPLKVGVEMGVSWYDMKVLDIH